MAACAVAVSSDLSSAGYADGMDVHLLLEMSVVAV